MTQSTICRQLIGGMIWILGLAIIAVMTSVASIRGIGKAIGMAGHAITRNGGMGTQQWINCIVIKCRRHPTILIVT